MYENGMTSREIGAAVNVPFRTVLRYLKKAGVRLRNPGGIHQALLDDKEWLERRYVVDGKSTTQIAEEIGATSRVVCTWLERHGIERRSRGAEKGHKRNTAAARRKMSLSKRGKYIGPDNWNWIGGKAQHFRDPERCRYRALRWSRDVRKRDGCCQECGSENDLHAHHIKRWKDYPELRYDLGNGVTLCRPCHERAHGRGFKFRW